MPSAAERIIFGRAELSDQGRLGPLLLEVYGPALAPENLAAGLARLSVSSLEDEFMAADDFYFSSIGLMDCCWLARDGEELAGAACVNPFVGELHYIAVRPAWRRLGIGRKLAELALGELVRRNCDHVRIEASLSLADAGGRAFAERLGFRPIRRLETFGMPLPAPGSDNPEPPGAMSFPAPAPANRRFAGGKDQGTIEM
ncbi:MAG: GNAT family N-acetyltransferase [Planctomycetota bacterium]|nr:GNAT family N-acetyltransferase [Planctomycetota bacterium]